MPNTKEIHKTLRSPRRINPPRPQLVATPVPSLAEKLRLQSHENRRVNADKIRPANNRLRNMLRQGYPATRDDSDLVPQSFLHELLVDLFQRSRDMPGFLRVIMTVIISIQVQSVHSLSCQLARKRSSVLPKRYSRDNNRGSKPARQLLEQIRSFSIILYSSRFLLYRLMEAVLVNNRNHPLPVRITPGLVMGNKQGSKLLRRRSNSRPNTHVSRR